MELEQGRRIAVDLMKLHGIWLFWDFSFDRAVRRRGSCNFLKHRITLSKPFVLMNSEEEVRKTVLHEIAHALVGGHHGHDGVWRAKCLAIGGDGERCNKASMPPGKWKAACPRCGTPYHRYRVPKQFDGWYCRPCGPELGKLAWKLTPPQGGATITLPSS